MTKPVIFYFVHAHGAGHLATFAMLYPALSRFFTVVAITTNDKITEQVRKAYAMTVIALPPKYPPAYVVPEHTFSQAFEVTPYATQPAQRAAYLAAAIERYRPVAFYCDGVPEIAIMVRGMGVPVVLVHLPGNIMPDPTQVFAHELADHIVAHFPESQEQPDYHYGSKTFYTGYISQYADRSNTHVAHSDIITILMGYDTYDEQVVRNMTDDKTRRFNIIGNKHEYTLGTNCRQYGRVADIAEAIKGDIVITAAGQNTIAELISLKKRLILLPEPRPYDEQLVHAKTLIKNKLACSADVTFTPQQWSDAIDQAAALSPHYDGLVNNNAPIDVARKMKEWYGGI